MKKSALRIKGILLRINIGTNENSDASMIELLSPEIKWGSNFWNVIIKINPRKKVLPEIKEALYFPGITTIFFRSKNLKVVKEK